jgi:DnaJ like chaperone protein
LASHHDVEKPRVARRFANRDQKSAANACKRPYHAIGLPNELRYGCTMSLWTSFADWFSAPHTAAQTAGGVALASERQLPVAFTAAVVALAAKMAKADGIVVGVEVEAFQRAFKVDPRDARNVTRLFKLAQQDTAGFEAYADQIARTVGADRSILRDVLTSLLHIATADRVLHPAEDTFLATVAERFGMSQSEYRHERAHFIADPESPYDVLGLTPSATSDDIKRRHRKLVRETHPDLMTGRGVPPDMIVIATRRLAAINDAYAVVAKERGL